MRSRWFQAFVLGLVLSTAQVMGAVEDSDDEFGLLPTGAPTCVFQSSITRVVEGKTVALHEAKHIATDENDFSEAIKKSCDKCVEVLSKTTRELREKGQVFFFQDKCFFVRCSYGKSESPVEISDKVFGEKLVSKQAAHYCLKRAVLGK